MPKTKRSPDEVEQVKAGILRHASALMCEEGYDGFSMRKLAARLGIAAKTIYNYFENKDEIYLTILTRGFETLFQLCQTAKHTQDSPLQQLRSMSLAYLDFGLENPQLYNLMFTYMVPKYQDYVETNMEPLARSELQTAIKIPELFIQVIQEAGTVSGQSSVDEKKALFLLLVLWTSAHGYVAGINNSFLTYMHANPISLKNEILDASMSEIAEMISNPSQEKSL